MRNIRLSPRAAQSLEKIVDYTLEAFGERQSLLYKDQLLERIRKLAAGIPPHGRPLATLVGRLIEAPLLYASAEGHFIVFLKNDNELAVIDFIHQSRDLNAAIDALTAKGDFN